MDTSSINSHPSLITARMAHTGRMPGRARSASEASARIQGMPEELPAVAKTAKAPATLNVAAPQHIGHNGEAQGGQSMLEQLKADWGKADSAWDLNGDGTVDIRDFLRLLAKISGGTRDAVEVPEQIGPNVKPVPQDIAEPGDEGAEGKTPIEQLLADWGKTDSAWDLNGDGTVNIRDFLQMLSKMDKASRAEDAPQERAPRVGHMERRARAAYSPTTAQDIALIRRGLSLNAVG